MYIFQGLSAVFSEWHWHYSVFLTFISDFCVDTLDKLSSSQDLVVGLVLKTRISNASCRLKLILLICPTAILR